MPRPSLPPLAALFALAGVVLGTSLGVGQRTHQPKPPEPPQIDPLNWFCEKRAAAGFAGVPPRLQAAQQTAARLLGDAPTSEPRRAVIYVGRVEDALFLTSNFLPLANADERAVAASDRLHVPLVLTSQRTDWTLRRIAEFLLRQEATDAVLKDVVVYVAREVHELPRYAALDRAGLGNVLVVGDGSRAASWAGLVAAIRRRGGAERVAGAYADLVALRERSSQHLADGAGGMCEVDLARLTPAQLASPVFERYLAARSARVARYQAAARLQNLFAPARDTSVGNAGLPTGLDVEYLLSEAVERPDPDQAGLLAALTGVLVELRNGGVSPDHYLPTLRGRLPWLLSHASLAVEADGGALAVVDLGDGRRADVGGLLAEARRAEAVPAEWAEVVDRPTLVDVAGLSAVDVARLFGKLNALVGLAPPKAGSPGPLLLLTRRPRLAVARVAALAAPGEVDIRVDGRTLDQLAKYGRIARAVLGSIGPPADGGSRVRFILGHYEADGGLLESLTAEAQVGTFRDCHLVALVCNPPDTPAAWEGFLRLADAALDHGALSVTFPTGVVDVPAATLAALALRADRALSESTPPSLAIRAAYSAAHGRLARALRAGPTEADRQRAIVEAFGVEALGFFLVNQRLHQPTIDRVLRALSADGGLLVPFVRQAPVMPPAETFTA